MQGKKVKTKYQKPSKPCPRKRRGMPRANTPCYTTSTKRKTRYKKAQVIKDA